jgi:uncharacterized protein (TIGR03437 family)
VQKISVRGLFFLYLSVNVGAGIALAQNYSYGISTAAGSDRLNDNEPATGTLLRYPEQLALDSSGNLYIADNDDNRIRKVTPDGTITTVAGNGEANSYGDGGPATEAAINAPTGVVIDHSGNILIAEYGSCVIRQVSPDGSISTFAGQVCDSGGPAFNGEGGPASAAVFEPDAIAIDAGGNIYVGDNYNSRIYKISPDGTLKTIAGTGTYGFIGDGGPATSAQIGSVGGIAVDSAGNIYFSDADHFRLRVIDPSGAIKTVAGNGESASGSVNGPALSASVSPWAVAVGTQSEVYFSDSLNNVIVRYDPGAQELSAVAGSGAVGFDGDGGLAVDAKLNYPQGLIVAGDGTIYLSDTLNGRVRKLSSGHIDTIAGAGPKNGLPANSAFLNRPSGVVSDAQGNIYIADYLNYEIRKVSASADHVISSIGTFGLDTGGPVSVALDRAGNIYATTTGHYLTRTTPAGVTTTIAGDGTPGYRGDTGPATQAELFQPTGVALDSQGNIYIADYGNSVVRKIATDGVISTVAGIAGNFVRSGDGGPATQAGIDPYGVAIDANDNLLIADMGNGAIRKVDPNGIITTVAGSGEHDAQGSPGPALEAAIGWPMGVAAGSDGSIYVAERWNDVVWRITPTGYASIIGGTGAPSPAGGDGGSALDANMRPVAVGVAPSGDLLVADYVNDRIHVLTQSLIGLQSLSLESGDSQHGAPGGTTPQPLKVYLTGADGAPYFGYPVTFSVTSGDAKISPSSVITDANGIASVSPVFGTNLGAVTVQASVPGLPPVSFTLQSLSGPEVPSTGVVGAGGSNPAVTAITPGGIFSIYGTSLASETRGLQGSDVVNNMLPINLAGTCVEVGGVRAPLFYVSPLQINAQTPALSGDDTSVVVILNCGTSSELRGAPVKVSLQTAAPEFFSIGYVSGSGVIAATDSLNPSLLIGPPGLMPGVTFTPAKAGQYVTLYATGLGALQAPLPAGQLAPAGVDSVAGSAKIKLAGSDLDPANVLYVGATPGFAGLYQVNIRIPQGTPTGHQPVTITLGGATSPSTSFLEIGN